MPITEIRPQTYRKDYLEEIDGKYKEGTRRQKEYAVDELCDYFQEQDAVIDLEDFYGSVDTLKAFFEQTTLHGYKCSAVNLTLRSPPWLFCGQPDGRPL